MNSPLVQESLARVVWSGAGLTLTLRDVLLALALVLGGGIASRLVAAVFRRRIAPRMAASRQTRELAPRWIFFGLWALFLLAALLWSGEYLRRAAQYPERIVVIDSTRTIEAIQIRLAEVLEKLL